MHKYLRDTTKVHLSKIEYTHEPHEETSNLYIWYQLGTPRIPFRGFDLRDQVNHSAVRDSGCESIYCKTLLKTCFIINPLLEKNWHMEFVKKTNPKLVNSEKNLNLPDQYSTYKYNVQLCEITFIYLNPIPPMRSQS